MTNNNDEVVLPSEMDSGESNSDSGRGVIRGLKWWVIILILVLLYVFYAPVTFAVIAFLEQYPTLYSYFLYIQSQIEGATLMGLFFFSIMGTLFFLILPSEGIILYYFASTDHFILYVLLFALAGNAIGMSFNYLFGRILGQRILIFLFGKENFVRYGRGVRRYGGYLLFIGNILPGPIEFISVFYGGFRFSYKRYIYLVLMGRLFKYVILFILFLYFWHDIVYYYDSIVSSFSGFLFF